MLLAGDSTDDSRAGNSHSACFRPNSGGGGGGGGYSGQSSAWQQKMPLRSIRAAGRTLSEMSYTDGVFEEISKAQVRVMRRGRGWKEGRRRRRGGREGGGGCVVGFVSGLVFDSAVGLVVDLYFEVVV